MMQTRFFNIRTAVAVVIANMVGTGVFTSLGFQLLEIQSGFVILMLWLVGGITALCGALTYAELGASLPRSGGEYHFLSQIYHPGAGFISGWVSATVGFAAPSALVAITFGKYLASVFPGINTTLSASLLVLVLTIGHCLSHRSSSGIQSSFTLIKVVLIICFCVSALLLSTEPVSISFYPQEGDIKLLTGGAFAVSLIYVNYAYTGWNAATYLSSELKNPQQSLPLILFVGTGLVLVLYMLLNFTFLSIAPMQAMEGKVEIGYIAADYAFGSTGANIMALVLALLLISTVSAMVLAGPRVLQVIGQDYKAFSMLAKASQDGIPYRAILFQSTLSLLFIWTASFESILVFSGFTLALNTLFTVFGVFVLRWRKPDLLRPYKLPLYPLTPLIFLSVTLWTLFYIALNRPEEALMALCLVLFGLVIYLLFKNRPEY